MIIQIKNNMKIRFRFVIKNLTKFFKTVLNFKDLKTED